MAKAKLPGIVAAAFLSWPCAVAAASPQPGRDLFPPIERILGHVNLPAVPKAGLRDALASRPTLESFLRSLRAKSAEDREQAVAALGYAGNVPGIPYLGAVLLRLNEQTSVRVAAALAMGRIRSPHAKVFLQKGLMDPVREVRFATALAVGQINLDGGVTMLERTLRSDPSWWVRYAAAMALGQTRRTFAVGSLERAAREDEQWQVRLQAARSMGELGTDHAASALAASLKDADDGVRAAAVMALGDIGGPVSLGLLDGALRREQDGFLRSLMASSIRKALSAP